MTHRLTSLFLLALIGCGGPAADAPVPQWTLVEDLRIGGADTGVRSFTAIAGLAFDPSGRIWIMDRSTRDLRVFGPTGEWIRTVGRAGQGPGEIGESNGFEIAPNGLVWVLDHGNRRYVTFDTAGHAVAIHTGLIRRFSYRWDGGLDTEGRLFDRIGIIHDTTVISAIRVFNDSSLTSADTIPFAQCRSKPGAYLEIPVANRGVRFESIPNAPTASSDISSGLVVWCTDGSAPHAVGIAARTGDTVAVIDYVRTPLPVDVAARDSAVLRIQERVREAGGEPRDFDDLPTHQPAIIGLFTDAKGRVWLQVPDTVGSRFDLFGPDGTRLAEVASPLKIPALYSGAFRGDTLLAVVLDEDDTPTVVRLHIDRGAAP